MTAFEWFVALWLIAILILSFYSWQVGRTRARLERTDRAIKQFDESLDRMVANAKKQERDEAFRKADRYYREFQ